MSGPHELRQGPSACFARHNFGPRRCTVLGTSVVQIFSRPMRIRVTLFGEFERYHFYFRRVAQTTRFSLCAELEGWPTRAIPVLLAKTK
jgi:hypothetical protein